MRKIVALFILCFGLCSFTHAQDFSFDDLVAMRKGHFPEFEAKVQGKGYQMDNVERKERCTIYKKGDNAISYCHYYDEGFSDKKHVAVKFETTDKAVYEQLKQAVAAGLQYHKTKLHRLAHSRYMEHIYVNNDVSVHLYDISFDNDSKPYYEIEVRSIYATY